MGNYHLRNIVQERSQRVAQIFVQTGIFRAVSIELELLPAGIASIWKNFSRALQGKNR
jgi:hypothetical protein